MIPTDSIAAGLFLAEDAIQSLRDITVLRSAAFALIDAATSIGCYQLVPTNPAAEQLATAAALLSDGTIKCSDRYHSDVDKVLIIDAATVSGNVTRACAADLRLGGATWVGAIIYDRVRPDLDGLDDEPLLDYVTALRFQGRKKR